MAVGVRAERRAGGGRHRGHPAVRARVRRPRGAPRSTSAAPSSRPSGSVALVYSVIEAPDAGWAATRTLAGLVGGLAGARRLRRLGAAPDAPAARPAGLPPPRLAAGSLSDLHPVLRLLRLHLHRSCSTCSCVRGDSAAACRRVSMLPMAAAMMPTRPARPDPRRPASAPAWSAPPGWSLDRRRPDAHRAADATSVATGCCAAGPSSCSASAWALAMTPATSGITEALPAAQQGVGSALNDLSRETRRRPRHRGHRQPPDRQLPQPPRPHRACPPRAPARPATRSRSPPAWAARSPRTPRAAFVDGMHLALLVAAGLVALAAVAVIALMRRAPPPARG